MAFLLVGEAREEHIKSLFVFVSVLLLSVSLPAEPLTPLQALNSPPLTQPHADAGGPLLKLNASYFGSQTFASHSGDTLRVSTSGANAGVQFGGQGIWAEAITYDLAYGLRFPASASIVLASGKEVPVSLLIHGLDWGIGYKVASPGGVDLGFRVFVGAEWPVDMNGYVFTGLDGYLAPQVWLALPSNGGWTWRLSAGVHLSKDFAPNSPGATPPPQPGPLPAGSVSSGDAIAFVRLDLEKLWQWK